MISTAQGSADQSTGRRVVVFAPGGESSSYASTLREIAGVTTVASTADYAGQVLDLAESGTAQATVFAELGVAVVDADADQIVALDAMCSADGAIRSVEPERVHRIRVDASADYVRGYRDGVLDLSGRLSGPVAAAAAAGPILDTDEFTWGLIATRVAVSAATGAGIKVAVLDTGLDLTHPDFAGRTITSQSFVAGAPTAQDGHGHGTHCVGTSCGPLAPTTGRRYGIAHGADIFVGKVLSDEGSGADAGILAGLNWALANGVAVVSMSLGADVRQVSKAYETVGRRALDAGTLIVAAAGNNADRPGDPGFVGVPANSPSIMAVGAIDSSLAIAPFSARSTTVDGGNVDVAAPGVDVYSSWPVFDSEPSRYNTISGTSMATPHVAGIAALWAQTTGRRGRDLWTTLTQEAARLTIPAADVGTGLTLAPQ